MFVFNIIDVASGSTLATFDAPQDAVLAAMNYPGIKTRIVKVPRVETNTTSSDNGVDPAVAAKEAASRLIESKFKDGTYHTPHLLSPSDPWFTPESLATFESALGFTLDSIPKDMYIHKSTQDSSKVCYVRWDERGQPSIIRVTYPRILEILGSPNVVSRDIGCFLREVNAKGTHIIARFRLHTRRLDIVDVYTNGPQSCMAHHEGNYETEDHGHPVGVYGRPDNNDTASPLGVYTYETGQWFSSGVDRGVDDDDDDYEGDPPREYYYTARTLVDHQSKIFSRLYGDNSEELAGYLRAIGYTRDGEGGRSFETCGSWFCPNVILDDDERVYLVMPYVDNYTNGYYDVRDGRVYFGSSRERVSVSTQVTSGLTRAYNLGGRTCSCCGADYVAPLNERFVDKVLEELGWLHSACPSCNNSGVAKEELVPTHVRTIVWYSMYNRNVLSVAPMTPVERALVSEGSHVLVFKDDRLRLYTLPASIPCDWEEVYPGVYWAEDTTTVYWRAAAMEYILWRCEFLPPSWFDESFMWCHRDYEEYFFVKRHGSRAKRYTTPCGLFVGYKSRWSSVKWMLPIVMNLSLFSPSIRRFVGRAPVTYSNALKEWQDANNQK